MAIENIDSIEETLGLESGTLTNAFSSEESVKVDLSGVKIMKNDAFQTLQDNHKRELEEKQVYSNQVGGEEFLKKVVKDFLPSDFEGRKDYEKVKAAIKALKMDESGFKPDEQLTEALKKVDAYEQKIGLQTKEITEHKDQYIQLQADVQKREDLGSVNAILAVEYAKYNKTSQLDESDSLKYFKADHDFKLENGQIVFYENGETVKDVLRNNMKAEDVFELWITKHLKQIEGGRKNEEKGELGTKMTYDKWEDAYKRANPNATSRDFSIALKQAHTSGLIQG